MITIPAYDSNQNHHHEEPMRVSWWSMKQLRWAPSLVWDWTSSRNPRLLRCQGMALLQIDGERSDERLLGDWWLMLHDASVTMFFFFFSMGFTWATSQVLKIFQCWSSTASANLPTWLPTKKGDHMALDGDQWCCGGTNWCHGSQGSHPMGCHQVDMAPRIVEDLPETQHQNL